MIKISTKTRYALRALLEIACRRDKPIFNLGELSRHQDISRKYLEHIFSALKKRGVVLSRAGRNGGFYLPRHLKDITILRILEALEGEVDIVDCRNSWRKCERISFCPAKAIWQELNAAIKKILDSKNLQDLSTKKEIREKCSYIFSKYKKTKLRHHNNS